MGQELRDKEARERIAKEVDVSFLVEAGAGSGKTTCLVERMVRLVVTHTCPIENMVAITFTRKAAAELQLRFMAGLEKALRGSSSDFERRLIQKAIAYHHTAFIGTIHSFCARVLRERPIEAHLTPDFGEIEEHEANLIVTRAWQDYLSCLQRENPADMEEIESLGIATDDLTAALKELTAHPDVVMPPGDVKLPELGAVRAALGALVESAKQYMPDSEPPRGWDALQKIMLACGSQSALDRLDYGALLALLDSINKQGKVIQNRWTDAKKAKEHSVCFDELRRDMIEPTLRHWQEYRYSVLIRHLVSTVRSSANQRLRAQTLSFQDLLMQCAALLRDNKEVRAYFQQRYTHLLVDEFQDTDPVQAEIVMLLTADDPQQADWRDARPRPGSLFVVGDPKQCIYRFRRADIEVYNCVRRQMLAAGGEVLYLTTNFRSLSSLVDEVNRIAKELFSKESAPYQTPFVESVAVVQPVLGAHGVHVLDVPAEDNDGEDDLAKRDASMIADFIRGALAGAMTLQRKDERESRVPVPSDFMVLVRKKEHMAEYARALERHGIRYSLSRGSGLNTNELLKCVIVLLKALGDPSDAVSVVAALRGPYLGISDVALCAHKASGGSFNYCYSVQDRGYKEEITSAFEKLKTMRRWVTKLTPSGAVERVMREIGIMALSSVDDAELSYASIVLALEVLRETEQQGTFLDAVDRLDLRLKEADEEDPDVLGASKDVVRIMNVHVAKGLEAPVVFLAHPGEKVSRRATMYVTRVQDRANVGLNGVADGCVAHSQPTGDAGAYGYLRIVKWRKHHEVTLAQPPGWAEHEAEHVRYANAEEVRLLYVAATRAKNLLVVSNNVKKPADSPWFHLVEHLQQAKRIEPIALTLAGQPVQAQHRGSPALLDAATVKAARDAILQGQSALVAASYEEVTVTGLKTKAGQEGSKKKRTRASNKKDEPAVRVTNGKGATWGTAIHKCLELMIKGRRINIAEILKENGRDVVEEQEVATVLDRVAAMPIWQRIMTAPERHTELSFGMTYGEKLIEGKIDLAFRDGDDWVLVDFKSDHIRDEAMLEKLVKRYAPQVRIYAEGFAAMADVPVKEAGLLFTEWGVYKDVGK